jgi:hypothetical protein
LSILGMLHMKKVPGNGVDWGRKDYKENRDLAL